MSTAIADASTKPGVVVGIVCERSVDLTGLVNEQGFLKELPHVRIIKVPCSGMIQPIMLEMALKQGAKGTFATGCRIGDCYYREGNKFLRERLLGTRMPKLKPSVDKRKVQAYWLSAVEYDMFKQLLTEFDVVLEGLAS
ncbi:MAG: hydrogenase iron-sulfur subunit [Candidatus Melainabacteria bacterium]|nr:hydrogenase iron-sulfur subunit [Candidatus Melainabacteria bacterium]